MAARKKRKKAAKGGSDDEEDDAGDGSDDRPLRRGDPELSSLEAATEAGAAAVASRTLQDSAVGLYDAALTRFPLSDVQRRVLAMIAAAGTRGAMQNELAATVGIDNRNFFYVIKVSAPPRLGRISAAEPCSQAACRQRFALLGPQFRPPLLLLPFCAFSSRFAPPGWLSP